MEVSAFDKELDALKTALHAFEPLDEKQRAFVLKTLAERMGISLSAASTKMALQEQPQNGATHIDGGTSAPAAAGGATGTGGIPAGQTPKEFLRSKSPKTDVQRIACLAFYLTHARKQAQFKTEDLTKLNTEAGGVTMSNPSMAVANATKQSNFLAAIGQAKKQITSLGEDVVMALPGAEAVKAALANHRKPRKKRAKKVISKPK